MGKKSDYGLLHQFSYPPYQLQAVTKEEVIVCGGGGGSKTGIPNFIEVLKLESYASAAVGASSLPSVRVVGNVDTSPDAVMALDVISCGVYFAIVAAHDKTCIEYHVRRVTETARDDDANGGDALRVDEKYEYKFEKGRVLQVSDSASVNALRCARDGTRLAVGCSDGQVHVFDWHTLARLRSCQAQTGGREVDCLDASPNWSRLCTLGGNDGCARLWRTADLSSVTELAFPGAAPPAGLPKGVSYKFKHCRFGRVEGATLSGRVDDSAHVLFTSHIPVQRSSKTPAPCFLVAWDCVKYNRARCFNTGPDIISALAVSDEGRYVALGSIEGSVAVHAAFSLQRLYRLRQAHNIFVTTLAFLPAARALHHEQDFELVSASADTLLRLHRVPRRTEYSCLVPLACAALLIWLFFYLMVELRL